MTSMPALHGVHHQDMKSRRTFFGESSCRRAFVTQGLLTLGVLSTWSVAFAQPLSTGVVNPALSPRIADYSIDARLDARARTITGSEVIAWRNITSRTVDELQFHLYWNAWRDSRSTWLREATLAGNTYDRRPDEWARIDVTSIVLGRRPDPGPGMNNGRTA